jgi:hypothetical protein
MNLIVADDHSNTVVARPNSRNYALADADYVHRLVLESAHCAGFDELESVRLRFDEIEPGTLVHEFRETYDAARGLFFFSITWGFA